MPKRLVGYDPLTGIKTYHDYDYASKKTVIGYEYPDVEKLLDWTKFLSGSGMKEYNRNKQMRHVACIPAAIINKWRVEEGIDIFSDEDWPRVKAKLNDPDWKYLRTDGSIL